MFRSLIVLGPLFLLNGFVLAGCVGKGEVLTFNLRETLTVPKQAGVDKPPAVVVNEFEDLRLDTTWLGKHIDLWGGITYYNVPDGNAGLMLAQVVIDYLNAKGWDARAGPRDGAAGDKKDKRPNIRITGRVQDFSAMARSRMVATQMSVRLVAEVQAENLADHSRVRMKLNSLRSETVFWYEPEDLRVLITAALHEAIENMLAATQVKDGALIVP